MLGFWPPNCTCGWFSGQCGEGLSLCWCCWSDCPNSCGHTQDVYFLKVQLNDTTLSFPLMSIKHILIAGKNTKSLLRKTQIRSNSFSRAFKMLVALLVPQI